MDDGAHFSIPSGLDTLRRRPSVVARGGGGGIASESSSSDDEYEAAVAEDALIIREGPVTVTAGTNGCCCWSDACSLEAKAANASRPMNPPLEGAVAVVGGEEVDASVDCCCGFSNDTVRRLVGDSCDFGDVVVGGLLLHVVLKPKETREVVSLAVLGESTQEESAADVCDDGDGETPSKALAASRRSM